MIIIHKKARRLSGATVIRGSRGKELYPMDAGLEVRELQ
jgi:hypothetical protein